MKNKQTKSQDLNMSRVWRDEIKTLKRHRRKVIADVLACATARKRKLRQLDRERVRAERAFDKALATIDKRVLILEGRLS